MEEKEKGVKYDQKKPDWTIFPFDAAEEVVRVLEFGEKKYARDNWKYVEPKERYIAAAFRHLIAYAIGEKTDKETGLNHLAHACCCLLFKIWGDNNENISG